jgi:hypothetical protein
MTGGLTTTLLADQEIQNRMVKVPTTTNLHDRDAHPGITEIPATMMIRATKGLPANNDLHASLDLHARKETLETHGTIAIHEILEVAEIVTSATIMRNRRVAAAETTMTTKDHEGKDRR